MKTSSLRLVCAFALLCGCRSLVLAQNASPAEAEVRIFSVSSPDLAAFEHHAALVKALGATHVVITDDPPLSTWEFDPANDPYPAWFVHHPGLLKIFPPPEVRPHVNPSFADRAAKIFEERCAVLRRLGLKAVWSSNEPSVMPEAFFTAYPELRGPRIDQPNRSRTARFATSVDRPEALRLYREAMKLLLARCPEVDTFLFVTTDAGSGFSWAGGLYPGANGDTEYRERPLEERVADFLVNLQRGANEGGKKIEVCLNQISPRQWMIPTFPNAPLLARLLPAGLAVNNLEGPGGTPFLRREGSGWKGVFYPVVGVPMPSLEADAPRSSRRQFIALGDRYSVEFNARLVRAMQGVTSKTKLERLTHLRAFAVTEVGEKQADDLLELWIALDDAKDGLAALDFGPMFTMGHVLGRWINRPLVPFPEQLAAEEKDYYRRFLFQAKGDEQADNLIDIQAMRMYEGWGARLLFQRVIETVVPKVQHAIRRAQRLAAEAENEPARQRWHVTTLRLQAIVCLLQTADHAVAFQAQLDRVKQLGAKPEANPVLGAQSSWDRTDLMGIARAEIDNTVKLMRLLQESSEPLLDLAPTRELESIMRLGPDLPLQLKRKIDTMNAHWMDYDRLFTAPNP